MTPGAVFPRIAVALALAVAACGGADPATDTPDVDVDDTDVAGVVIERSEDADTAETGTRLPAGPATVGITWTRVDDAWVGLGARTLTAGEPVEMLVLDVAADDTPAARPHGCEVLLQAPAGGLLADGRLDVRISIEGPDGASRVVALDPVRLDVELPAGEHHRAPVSGGERLTAALDGTTDEAATVRCEGRFEPS